MSKPLNQWQLQNFGRIDLKPEEFDRAIYQKGARVVWEKSMLCSCIDENSGQGDFTCPACKGKGYIFFGAENIRAVVGSINGGRDQTPIGLLDVGTSYVTTRAENLVGFRDRLTFTDFVTPYSQVITFDEGKNADKGMKLRYDIKSIVSIRILSTEIPKENWTLSDDHKYIKFDEGIMGDGDRFSVLAQVAPSYIVIDLPHELRGTFVKFGNPDEEWVILPKQLMVKREDLMPLQRGQVL
ncbi:hypothetical protein [Bacillus phage YungSlug]|nr:hypothetical protein [Bacillus phage YungSlug]